MTAKSLVLILGLSVAFPKAQAKLEATPSESEKFAPVSANVALPTVTPAGGTAATGSPANAPALLPYVGTPPTTGANPQFPIANTPQTLYMQPLTVIPVYYPPPIPNISTNTATALPMLAAFMAAMSGGKNGGALPPNSYFSNPMIGADGIYQNPLLYSGTASNYTNADSYSAAAAAQMYKDHPEYNSIPNCHAPSGGPVAQIPTTVSPNLSGHTCSSRDTDRLTCMVCNLMFEAGNEPRDGQLAVVRSVMSRVFSNAYPDTVCKVVYQGNGRFAQYSWTYEHKNHQLPGGSKLQDLIAVAQEGMKEGPDCTTNYFNGSLCNPDWSHNGTCASTLHTIGAHTFCSVNGTPTRTVAQVAAAENLYEIPTTMAGSSDGAAGSY